MKGQFVLWIFVLLLTANNVWAYGSSSSSKSCAKPKFTEFTPANNAQVAAGSAISFFASPNTLSDSISVTVKNQPINIQLQEKASGIVVTGTLPPELKNTVARININAEAHNACKGSDGWLVQIQ